MRRRLIRKPRRLSSQIVDAVWTFGTFGASGGVSKRRRDFDNTETVARMVAWGAAFVTTVAGGAIDATPRSDELWECRLVVERRAKVIHGCVHDKSSRPKISSGICIFVLLVLICLWVSNRDGSYFGRVLGTNQPFWESSLFLGEILQKGSTGTLILKKGGCDWVAKNASKQDATRVSTGSNQVTDA
jgi:hypothetical protein